MKLIDGMVKDGLTDVYNKAHMGVIQSQNDAHNHIRSQWDEMDPSNPHSASTS